METNEVQWHPPEQLLSAAPDTQTAGDDQLPGIDGEEKCEQGDLEDKDDSEEAKGDLEIQIAAAMCLQVIMCLICNCACGQSSDSLAKYLERSLHCMKALLSNLCLKLHAL